MAPQRGRGEGSAASDLAVLIPVAESVGEQPKGRVSPGRLGPSLIIETRADGAPFADRGTDADDETDGTTRTVGSERRRMMMTARDPATYTAPCSFRSRSQASQPAVGSW